jgi:uncharacterized membrane-anchored protein
MKKIALFACLLFGATFMKAQTDSFSTNELTELFRNDSILKSFQYQTGKVVIGENLATINVPAGCLYLNPEQSKYMMESIFGNPPSPASLGMLLSDTPSMITGARWIIDFNYNADGHVNDDDAADIKYDELLKQLIEETEAASKERIAQGYESVKMLGWAQAPFYDSKNKKLHWAKELAFGKDEGHTLNYNIRILGREGYLEMNIITGIDMLPEVKKDIDMILGSTNFNEGQRYADFNEDTDKLAEYGIGGLIVGGVLAKTGILAKIGIFLLKIIKPLIVGVIALFAFIGKRIFGRKKEEEEFNTVSQEVKAPEADNSEENKTQE